MRIALGVVVLLAAACDEGTATPTVDAGPCDLADQPGPPPTGTWSATWECNAGCGGAPPAITAADLVRFGDGSAVWSDQAVMIATHPAQARGACVDVTIDDVACGVVPLCLRGDGLVYAAPLEWSDGQRWTLAVRR